MRTTIYGLATIVIGLVIIIFRKRIINSVYSDDNKMYGSFWKYFMVGGEAVQRKLNYWIFLLFGLLFVIAGALSLLRR